jgi:LmbE family N-acetylglucosaminyl deacetylase
MSEAAGRFATMTQPLSPLTLMAVHAHPDDEASSTGGVLAKYSDEGLRTIVVTCTNGEFGDGPAGLKPGEDGHDTADVAQTRLAELRESCKHLGVTELETLGYHDSGMPEWEYKDNPEAFCNVPLDTVIGRISALIEKYRPAIVITYDPDGAYQHPDHVHAARAAIGAVEKTGIPAKLYLTAMRRSDWQKIAEALRAAGEQIDEWEPTEEEIANMRESEARITTTIDIAPFLERKRTALMTHASQIADSWFSKIPPDVAAAAFGKETFILSVDKVNSTVPETDLLSGLS